MKLIPFKPEMQLTPVVIPFFDEPTNTFSYIIKDPNSNSCAVVDSVWDLDYASGRTSFKSADEIIAYIKNNNWKLEWIIETHVHADHLSAAPYIQQQLGGKIGIGAAITTVQDTFAKIFNEGTEFERDGSQFDQLFEDGESYQIGTMTGYALHTPGHTPACMTHVIGNACFVGDTIFMPDFGTARADFPGGDAKMLYQSIQRLLSLPDEMRLFMCHDYMPGGREPQWESTVAEQKQGNIHVHNGISESDFVSMRESRDKTLGMPRLIFPSLQVNMRAGHLPPPEGNSDKVYLKVPINVV